MTWSVIEPEVAGGLGPRTRMDRSVHPPVVLSLHYVFDGWLGDALLESFPAFIVTHAAQDALVQAGVTGARFDAVDVELSDQFAMLHPGLVLPDFAWLRVDGRAGQDDVGTLADGRLVVSQRVRDILERLGLAHALIDPFEG